MTRLENSEQKTFTAGAGLLDREGLSQSAQNFFQPIDRAITNSADLPWALDFGTGADLYRSAAYTGGRLSASALMADEPEQKLDAPKIQRPSDATAEGGVISGRTNQNEHGTAFKIVHAADRTPSGIMPALHESFGIEGDLTAADLGIKSNKAQEKLALRDDYLDRYELKKLEPKDGDNLPLKQILEDYKTPFMDAYEHSKQLKNGDPGKSKTLEEVVNRLKDCPWADKIHVKFNSRADNTEYDELSSTITIRPQDTPQKRTENFAHEGFHATHQFLSKLYDHGIVSPKDFENIWMQGEVDSMLTEVRVHDELGLKGDSPRFNYLRNGKEEHIDIQEYVKKFGREGFLEFLRTAQPAGEGAKPYGEHYSSFYESYKANFEKNKPAVQKYIQQWVQSGHRREDI